MSEFAYVNGEICAIDDARVPVRDRGFIFGDGVYDVARVYRGRPFRLEAHLARLLGNAAELGFEPIPDGDDLAGIVDELLERSGLQEAMIYMQLTRGAARRQSAFPADTEPTVYVSVEEIRRGAGDLRDEGATAILVEDIRWDRNDIKTINLLPKVLMGDRAHRQGAYEALYRDADGHVWEGTSTNIFAVEGGALHTPPLGPRVLPGTTRADIIGIAGALEIRVHERALTVEELRDADELFLTGTLTEVLGLVSIDGERIGDGRVGAVTRRVARAYVEHTGR